ncbi:MAG: peptidase MA family metallohydrolase [Anaerolineae bacterium]|nr:peptidase MA family metallohydrolase [Anaerolineae bacterium]
MNKTIIKMITVFMILLMGGGQSALAAEGMQGESPITFSGGQTENHFPDELTLKITAESSAGEIVSATLYYYFRGSKSVTRQIVEFEPGAKVELSFTYITRKITIPPSSLINYYWEASDSAGNLLRSEEYQVFYDDLRFDWNILEDENLAVWWHDRPQDFGETVYTIAQQAFAEQHDVFQAELDFQIRIIIYNNFDEFATWHTYVDEFVGGEAYSDDGLTVQIVPESTSYEHWLNDVIPHEISHLYFYQVTYNPMVEVPHWLNEGVAQYNENTDNSESLRNAKVVIGNGGLIPLWSLTGGFGYDETKFRFAYDEAISATVYIVETYGEEGLAKLMAAYKNGKSGDAAFEHAFGRNILEFQEDWLVWMGVSPSMYPTPTAQPALVWPTAPSYSTPSSATPPPTAQESPGLFCLPLGGFIMAVMGVGVVGYSRKDR